VSASVPPAPAAAQTQTQTPAARTPPASRQFALLLALQFAFGIAFSIFVLLPKILASTLHAGPGGIGLVTSMFSLAGVAAVPFVGARVDRAGRPRLIVAGTALMFVASLAFMAVDRVGPLALLLRAAQGVAYTVVFVTGAALAADGAPPDRMARTMALYGSSNLVTNAVSPLFAEPMIDHLGPRSVYVAAAFVSLVAGLLGRRLVERPPPPPHAGADASLWAVMRRPRALRIMTVMILAGIALGGMFTFSQPMAIERGFKHVGGFFISYTLAVIGVRIVLHDLVDRVGPQRACVGALLMYAVVVFSMRWLGVDFGVGHLGLSTLGAVFGVAHGFLFPAAMALGIADLPTAERGRMLTLTNAGFIGGGAFVLPLGGIAARAGYPALYALCAAGVLAAAALLWRRPIAGPRAVP
jgi:predicted MFS family arabinose efflux permease